MNLNQFPYSRRTRSVTIGIPAHNEESGLRQLLAALETQSEKIAKIRSVIVVSDGSQDNTITVARSFPKLPIRVVERRMRRGKASSLNLIRRKTVTDILVFLDADVIPKDNNFLDHLVKPFVHDPLVGCVGAIISPSFHQSFFGHTLRIGDQMKREMVDRINGGDNGYAIHGRAYALGKNVYRGIRWPSNCPDDGFTALFCRFHRVRVRSSKDAVVLYQQPRNVADYLKQSRRFWKGLVALSTRFPTSVIRNDFGIPFQLFFSSFLRAFLKSPVYSTCYFFAIVTARLFSFRAQESIFPYWGTSRSTKEQNENP